MNQRVSAINLPMRTWYIYVLIDPRNGEVRYVGWTVHPKTRLRDHIKPSRVSGNQRRDRWIASLLRHGFRPRMDIIECGTGDYAKAESHWIRHYRSLGYDLTNHTDGGEGAPGRRHTAEAKARMSEKRRGRKPTPQALAAARAATLGKSRPAHVVAAMRSKLRGREKSAEHRKNLAASKLGKKLSDAHRKKLSEAHQKRSPEERKRQARHAALSQRPASEEKRRRISEAKKAWWAIRSAEERSEFMRQIRIKKHDAAYRATAASVRCL